MKTARLFGYALMVAVAMTAVIAPIFAKETGPTCAEKYRAAKATGKLKPGITQALFMARCAGEARARTASANKPRPE